MTVRGVGDEGSGGMVKNRERECMLYERKISGDTIDLLFSLLEVLSSRNNKYFERS